MIEYYAYRNPDGTINYLYPGGYVAHDDYMDLMVSADRFCGEIEIIDRINENEDGYFDFDKAIVDVGSEIGVYSFKTKFATAHLFEGNRIRSAISGFNMVLNGKTDFTVNNILLSDRQEIIRYDGFLTEYSDVEDRVRKKDQIVNALAKPLDSFELNNVGFIKMDVEGMEYKVIQGAKETIERNGYPPILFECWGVDEGREAFHMTQERRDKLEKLLADMGYRVLWNWGDFETHLAVHE